MIRTEPQPISVGPAPANGAAARRRLLRIAGWVAAAVLLFVLVFWNLDRYPAIWYDEGSHLHVPKTLVTQGVYADVSSEGYRYYGPTIGVGPTVMLPVAAAFKLAGIGLLQARIVMALYLLGTIVCFWGLAAALHGRRYALWAAALLLSSAGVGLIAYGRQMLGEVPGLFFLLAALWLWLPHHTTASWGRLLAAGALLGLAMVTKYQFLILIVPALGLLWLANLVYYRAAPQRTYWLLGITAVLVFGGWQLFQIAALAPATFAENLAQFRQFSGGAALVFSTDALRRALSSLLSFDAYGWLIVPGLLYGLWLARRRTPEGHQWGVVAALVGVNLLWFVVASIGWVRYAFPGLALGALLVARLIADLTDNFAPDLRTRPWRAAAQLALLAYVLVVIALPLRQTVRQIVSPPPDSAGQMAAVLDRVVPLDAVVETWEPELGFLTDHNYHYPPQILLNQAVRATWSGEESPWQEYRATLDELQPDYIVFGPFAGWVKMYVEEEMPDYEYIETVGIYGYYKRR